MMSEPVKLLFSLSLSGTILAVIIFLLKPFVKNKISKSVQYYIWLVVLLRLILPFSFESSLMNNLFYWDSNVIEVPEQTAVKLEVIVPGEATSILDLERNVDMGVYNNDVDHGRFLQDLFNQYALYLWLLGLIAVLMFNIFGYLSFSRNLKLSNKEATEEEGELLKELLQGKHRGLKVKRNSFINTPMLIGVIKPIILIPDNSYDMSQLRNILSHEIAHLKRKDILVKWFTMVVSAVHWFNPFMYFVKKEINSACELACDEDVIKNLSVNEKQSYGETLISVVSEQKCPNGMLQATMCEEKKSLKERLVAIMKHKKKSKLITGLSVLLFLCIVTGSIFLGAGIGKEKAINVDNVDNVDKEYSIENDKFGFSLVLPKDFAKNVTVKEKGNFIYFVAKDIQSMYSDAIMGTVGRIEIYDKNEITKDSLKELEDAYNLRYLGENEKYYFGWAHATDVQIPPNASAQIEDNYRSLESEFDKVIKTITIKNSSNNKANSSAVDEYSLMDGKQSISLMERDIEKIYKILGKPKSENVEVLGSGADTFVGSKIKTLKYEAIEIKLFSPNDKETGFWVMSMEPTASGIKTLKGISIGSSLEELKKAYSNIEVLPEGRKDKTTYTYRISNHEESKHMEYIVKDGSVIKIRLYVEMP
jgi:beta-lactamase regulating signal transducer with metallopeptidase domain